jgi:PilZ domain
MARHVERCEDVVMYTAMLDLISNRVQQPAGSAASKSERIAMEHRWGQRSKLDVEVRLHATSWRAPRRACLRNISASGALLETEPSLPPLKRIEVEIAVRKQGHIDLIRIPACVLRKADHGVGVEWCESMPFAVEQLVADAIDLIGSPPALPSRSTGYEVEVTPQSLRTHNPS